MHILKIHRERRHLTLRQMALKLNMSIGMLSMVENGQRRLSLKSANRINLKTKISIRKLIEDNK